VPDSSPAVIRLADGSRATFEPASEAVLFGRTAGQRQLVELVAGGGAFQVVEGGGGFEVKTALGRVTALGTEFSVRLLAPSDRDRESDRAGAGHAAMAVAVQSGAVRVEFGGETYTLQAGQSRRFAPEGNRKPRAATCSGELIRVEAGEITIARKNGKAEETKTLTVDSATRVHIVTEQTEPLLGEGGKGDERMKVVEGSLRDLKVGQQVIAVYGDDGARAVKVLIRRPAPPR
jgi:hypothetical protein